MLLSICFLVFSLLIDSSYSFIHQPAGGRQQQQRRLQIFARRTGRGSGTALERTAYTSEGAPTFEARPIFTNKNITYSNKRVDIDWHNTLPTTSSSSSSSSSSSMSSVPLPRSKPVPRKVEERIAQVLIRKGEFSSGGKMITSRIEEIEEACKALNAHAAEAAQSSSQQQVQEGEMNLAAPLPTTSITVQQALSLRKQLLVSKIRKDSWRVHHDLNKLVDRYTKGNKSLIDLAREFDLPPVAIFRAILGNRVRKHWPALLDRDVRDLVKRALRLEGEAFAACMNIRDQRELAAAKCVDHMSFAEDNVQEKDFANMWEECLYSYLDSLGVSYVKEETLKALGTTSTPDCVCIDDVHVNGVRIRWIDMKCFYGTSMSRDYLMKLEKQIARYNEEFQGNGAIVYRLGYSAHLQTLLSRGQNKTLLLDAGNLNLACSLQGDFELE